MKNSRRNFLKGIGLGSSALAVARGLTSASYPSATGFSCLGADEAASAPQKDFITIRNPHWLKLAKIEAERIPVGQKGEYKPCIAHLGGNELLLVCYLANVKELPTYIYRSGDGGQTWEGPDKTSLPGGGEPYLTRLRDGTLLLTGGPWGYRSPDGGKSWQKCLEPADFAARAKTGLSRNILQLKDGSLLQIVDVPGSQPPYTYGNEYVARSYDGGQTWPEIYKLQAEGVPAGYPWSIFGEAILWQARSGKLYAIARVDHRHFPIPGRTLSNLEMASVACSLFQYGYPLVKDISEAELDQLNHLKIFTSTDLGRTWQAGADLGDYGNMFHSILRLKDGRLLFTFTQRSIDPPLGVRAVLGRETEDGFDLDFKHDIILIDTKTPIGRGSGGGFGPTVQLDDGTLVTSYSYWPPDDKRAPNDWKLPNPSQCEVARWRLP